MKLELKHLAPYLPYQLKAILTHDRRDDFYDEIWNNRNEIFKKDAIWQLCGYADSDLHIPLGEGEIDGFLWRNTTTYVNFHYGIKPILRPLSDLTKEIVIGKEKFIPCNILFEKEHPRHLSKEYYNQVFFNYIRVSHNATAADLKIYLDKIITQNPYWVIDYLLRWHFDVFALIEKGLAIDINTLPTNNLEQTNVTC